MEKSLPNPIDRLIVIDTLRVFAASWVLLFHLSWQIRLFFWADGLFTQFISFGFLGVDLFFFLSGWLAAYRYQDVATKDGYKRFLVNRLIRLYPLHVAILISMAIAIGGLGFAGYAPRNPENYSVAGFISQIFMVSAWNFPATMSWNYFAWAISALWLMILLTPAFMRVLHTIRSRPVLLVLAAFLAVLTPLMMHLWPHRSFVAYALPRALAGYGIGMILFYVLGALDRMVATHKKIWSERYRAVIAYMAALSYSLYMTQYPVLLAFKTFISTQELMRMSVSIQIAALAMQIVLCVIAAVLAYHGIEKPTARWLMARFQKRIG